MKREMFNLVPTTYIDENVEEWKYTVIYTDVWEIQVFKTLEETMAEIKDCKDKWELFRTKKLDEYSRTLQHFGEFVIDLSTAKILWYKEHHIIDNFKLQNELNEAKAKEEAEKENTK